MMRTINVPIGEKLIYDNVIETEYDDIILTYGHSNYISLPHGNHRHDKYISVFKMPNTIIYQYDGPKEGMTLDNVELLHGKYLYLHYKIEQKNKNDVIRIIDIKTGAVSIERFTKIGSYPNSCGVMGHTYEEMNFILLCYSDGQKYCTEIFDESFNVIHKYYGCLITNIKKCSGSEQNILERMEKDPPRGKYCFNPNIISGDRVALYNDCHIQVYDLTNRKILFEHTESKNIQFIRWQNNSIIYQIDSVIKIQEIVNKDECIVCFLNIDEKHAMIPCGHTQTCFKCATRVKNCPICRCDISSVVKLL